MKKKNLLLACLVLVIGIAGATASNSNRATTTYTDGAGHTLQPSEVANCTGGSIFCANKYQDNNPLGPIFKAD